jgi:hypothetical protein
VGAVFVLTGGDDGSGGGEGAATAGGEAEYPGIGTEERWPTPSATRSPAW